MNFQEDIFVKNQILLALSLWDSDNIASKRIIENLIKSMVMTECLSLMFKDKEG